MTDDLAALARRVDQLSDELGELRGDIRRLEESRVEHGSALGRFEDRLTTLEGQLGEVLRHQGSMSAQLVAISNQLSRGTVAAAGLPSGVVVLVAAAVEFARWVGWLPR